MPHFDFCSKDSEERETITFGTSSKKITIDATFIPSLLGYRIKTMLVKDKETNTYSPETLASIIAMFTDEVDAAWIVENCDYPTLDQVVGVLYTKALIKIPEKN